MIRSPLLRVATFRSSGMLVLLVLASLFAGCKDKGGGPSSECPDGTDGCPCLPSGGCDPAAPNLVCLDDVCVAAETPDPGELNGPCDETVACATYEGEALECINGTCQLPDCLSGLVGCPCGAAFSCDDPTVEGETCVEGTCQLEGCVPGSLGCACEAGGACQSGLECVADVCRSAAGSWLVVGDPTVRACDVVLTENGGRVGLVTFTANVIGESMSRAPRTAVSLAARADATLVGDVARIELVDTTAGARVEIESATCYDLLGQAVTGTPVSIR